MRQYICEVLLADTSTVKKSSTVALLMTNTGAPPGVLSRNVYSGDWNPTMIAAHTENDNYIYTDTSIIHVHIHVRMCKLHNCTKIVTCLACPYSIQICVKKYTSYYVRFWVDTVVVKLQLIST